MVFNQFSKIENTLVLEAQRYMNKSRGAHSIRARSRLFCEVDMAEVFRRGVDVNGRGIGEA